MHAEIFTKDNCLFCIRAKDLMTKRGLSYTEISAVEHRDTLIERVIAATGDIPKTVPQIFINENLYIGGYDQLAAWLDKIQV